MLNEFITDKTINLEKIDLNVKNRIHSIDVFIQNLNKPVKYQIEFNPQDSKYFCFQLDNNDPKIKLYTINSEFKLPPIDLIVKYFFDPRSKFIRFYLQFFDKFNDTFKNIYIKYLVSHKTNFQVIEFEDDNCFDCKNEQFFTNKLLKEIIEQFNNKLLSRNFRSQEKKIFIENDVWRWFTGKM